MKQAFTLLAATTALAACSTTSMPERAPGASFYERQEVVIEAANSLVVAGPFEVSVNASASEPELILFGPPEMIADTRVVVKDGTLSIGFVDGARWGWNPGAGMHASVSLPALQSVATKGSGSVDVYGVKTETFGAATGGSGSITVKRLEANTFQAATGGSGSITVDNLSAKAVQLATGGSGSIHIHGKAESASIGTAGSGSIDAKRLRVETADIGVSGSGSVYADVTRTAQIAVLGSGRVDVVGGAQCTVPPSHKPKVECR